MVDDRAPSDDLAWAAQRALTRVAADAPPVEDLLQKVLTAADLLRPALAHRLGMGVNDVRAMEHLVAHPIGPAELARRLEVTTAAATVMLDRLERAGHVRRDRHPTDARRLVVHVTDSGQASTLRELRPIIEELDAAADALTPAEREVVARYLSAVLTALEHAVHPEAGGHPDASAGERSPVIRTR